MLTLLQNRNARVGLAILAVFAVTAVVGPFIIDDPFAFVARPHEPPSLRHWLGTTGQGQDVLAQLVVGTQVTLAVAFAVGLVVTFIGALVGTAAAYFGGRIDNLLSLLTNVFLIMPGLPLAVVIAVYLPAGPLTITFVLIVTGWAWNARLLRAQALSLRHRDFVAAAIVGGESHLRVIVWEILPNMFSLLVSCFISATTYALGAQVGLEFLGLGDISIVTWGTNLYWASNDAALLTGSWWMFVPTGVCIALVGFALVMVNFAADEISNARLRAERTWREQLRREGIRVGRSTPVLRKR